MAARVAITFPAFGREGYNAALEACVVLNCAWLRLNSWAPMLEASSVVFKQEPNAGTGIELFQTIPEVLSQGWGDCDDLAAWSAAELRVRRGLAARAELEERSSARVGGGRSYHAIVRLQDGRTIDPSEVLARIGRVQR